jgi:Fibronectin type III domain
MNKAKGTWRQLRALWPVAVAVLTACGGASDPAEDTANTDETEVATNNMESAEGRRRNSWVYCAAEGATCGVASRRLVRYGANGAYFYKMVSGSIACNNRTWGDPAVGVYKQCDYAAGTNVAAPAPGPAPAPTPSPAPTPAPAPTTPAPAPVPGSVTLSWSAPTEQTVAGYRLYYGTASGSYQQARGGGMQVGSATTYTAANLMRGVTYYFVVTAVDSAGNDSAYSNEVNKLIP